MTASFAVNTNITALTTDGSIKKIQDNQRRSLERISSGLRINRAADDASGLAISELMRGQIRGTEQAQKNLQDGISLLDTAEAGIGVIGDMLQRLRMLAIQSANDTMTTGDRDHIQTEVSQLLSEIDRQASTIHFNTKTLLTGEWQTTELVLQAGANANEEIAINLSETGATALGVDALSLTTRVAAESAISVIDKALRQVDGDRTRIGAWTERALSAFENAANKRLGESEADSRLRDLDYAAEIINLTKEDILAQTAASALAQANIMPQSVLQLLR